MVGFCHWHIPTFIIADISPPWWDFVMVGMCWVTIIINATKLEWWWWIDKLMNLAIEMKMNIVTTVDQPLNIRQQGGPNDFSKLKIDYIWCPCKVNGFRPTAPKSLSQIKIVSNYVSHLYQIFLCTEKVWFSVDKAKVAEVFYADPDIKPHFMQITSTYAENHTFCR